MILFNLSQIFYLKRHFKYINKIAKRLKNPLYKVIMLTKELTKSLQVIAITY